MRDILFFKTDATKKYVSFGEAMQSNLRAEYAAFFYEVLVRVKVY